MITLHESNITSFPLDNGIGVLSDAIIAHAEEEINSIFEFYMEYDSDGVLVDELKKERIIKAKAQDKLGYQLFRIYRVGKHHENDNIVVLARHITYDLAHNFVEEMIANGLTKKQVMEKIGSSTVEPHPFNVTSSNTTTMSSTRLYRTNPIQMIAGMDGSVLQIWGGQLERDNFNLILHDRRGHDDGVTVTYEKNITGLTAEFDIGSLVTRIFPFVFIEATDDTPERLITVNGKYIDSPHINDYEKVYIEPIDFSYDNRIDVHDKTDSEIRQQLEQVASEYFNETGNDKRKATMEVAFAHLWETEEYKHVAPLELVGMGDNVTINHSKLKVDATAIVNYIRYDCIAHVNEEVRLGNVKAGLTDSIGKINEALRRSEQAETNANRAIVSANGKNITIFGPDEPTEGMQKGDLWFKVVDDQYTRTYRFDGIEWQLIIDMDSHEAKEQAQQAKDIANQSVATANQAIGDAQNAINQAQTAFDDAQKALDGLTTLYEFRDDTTGDLTLIKGDIQGLQTSVSGKVDESTYNTFVQQTNQSLATKITMEDAENNLVKQTTFTATIDGLQTQVSDNAGNISNVTQLANTHQTQIVNLQGDVSTLTQTSNSLVSNISSLQDDFNNLEIGGRNYVRELGGENYNIDRVYSSDRGRTSIVTVDGKKWLRYTGYIGLRVAPINVEPDSVYTWSLTAYADESSEIRLGFYSGGGYNYKYVDIGTVPKRIYVSGRTKEDATGELFHIWNLSEDAVYYFSDFQLEKGNTATGWTPAPEDMATQSQITQLSNNINLRVEKGNVLSQLNIEAGRTLIDTDKLILSANTTHVTGDFKLDGSAHIKDASIGTAQIGYIDAAKINSGELNTNNITIHGGSATEYTNIQGSTIDLRGTYTRTWRGNTTTHDVLTRLHKGHIRFRNDNLQRSLYISEFGISTYLDGEGELGGSSGSIIWWDTEYSPSNQRGITVNSYGGTAALVSDHHHALIKSKYSTTIESTESPIDIITHSDDTKRGFRFTKSTDKLRGYLLFGDTNYKGFRFDNSEDGIVQVVDSNLLTGGSTSIEAGTGRFNRVTWREGASYFDILNENYFRVGNDGSRRVASIAIYNRTYSAGANMHITNEGTLGRSTSARKYKTDIEPIAEEYAYNFFNNVHPVFYRPSGTSHDERKDWSHYGYIADDVALIEPRLVQFRDGEPESFNYDRVPTLLHVVLKEEVKRIDFIEKTLNKTADKVSVLELKVQVLEQKIEQLEAS